MWNKFFFLALFLTGCSYSTFYVPVERLVYPPSDPRAIAVSTQKTIKQPHKILRRIAVMSFGDGDSARTMLQDEAAKIGANLVIDLRLEKGMGRTSASGLAVLLMQEK